jgi:hypothetical protein
MKLVLRRSKYNWIHDKKYSVTEILTLTILFLAAINILKTENYLLFAALVLLLFTKSRFVISLKVVPVALFSFALLIFWEQTHATLSTMVSAFVYPVCFVVGYCLMERREGLSQKTHLFVTIAMVLAFGNLIHLLMNVLTNIDSDNRNLTDIWTGAIRSATSQSALGVGTVTVTVATLFSDTKRLHKLLAFIVLLVAMWCNLILAGRTLYVITLTVIAVAVLYKLKSTKSSRFRTIIWLFVAVVAIVIAFNQNLFGIRQIVENSNFYNRFFGDYSEDISETGRWERKLPYIKLMLDYPFGGNHINELVGGYAHDLYLDTYDEAGVLAMVFILVVEVQSIGTMVKLMKKANISDYVKLTTLGILTGYHLMFIMEPIIAGLEWLLSNYCILYGAAVCLLNEKDE